jgi:hypothetical protein
MVLKKMMAVFTPREKAVLLPNQLKMQDIESKGLNRLSSFCDALQKEKQWKNRAAMFPHIPFNF